MREARAPWSGSVDSSHTGGVEAAAGQMHSSSVSCVAIDGSGMEEIREEEEVGRRGKKGGWGEGQHGSAVSSGTGWKRGADERCEVTGEERVGGRTVVSVDGARSEDGVRSEECSCSRW